MLRASSHTLIRTDEIVTVIEQATWDLGIGDRFDETRLKAYPAGSFIVIPADVAHFLATKEGPVIVQVSGHGVFRTNYVGNGSAVLGDRQHCTGTIPMFAAPVKEHVRGWG